jgi:hypothetical protein
VAVIQFFVQNRYEHTEEWQRVCAIAESLANYLDADEVKQKISLANQPGSGSGVVQRVLLEHAAELGFVDESRGLFSNYRNRGLRPDYYCALPNGTGILMEVERGKTNINNMDFLDFWKCHICDSAHYLFLLVPQELRQSEKRSSTKPFSTTVGHIEAFFQPKNYTNVRGAVIFGY